jgi:hypothetical protein
MKSEMPTAATLVERVRAALPSSHEFDERDLTLLDLAERQAADIDRLEADIAERGVRVGERLNNAIPEVRQSRVALARILGQVDIPEAGTTRSQRARRVANARWKKAA